MAILNENLFLWDQRGKPSSWRDGSILIIPSFALIRHLLNIETVIFYLYQTQLLCLIDSM